MTVGHLAIGLVAARVFPKRDAKVRLSVAAMLWWCLLAVLPDVDFVGFMLGLVQNGSIWGHRGFTHSFAFAIVVGAAVGVAARSMQHPSVRTSAIACLVVASHPILDAFTSGGRGCALFWPLTETRYLFPWNPLPTAPLGLRLLSSDGLRVIALELVVFSPLLLFALWPKRASEIPDEAPEDHDGHKGKT